MTTMNAVFGVGDEVSLQQFQDNGDQARVQSQPVFDDFTVGEFVHDIRNTIWAVSLLSELMLQELAEGSRARGMAHDVQHACEDASAQCQRILAARRGAPAQAEPTDLSALVRAVTPLLATWVPSASVLRFNLATDLPLLKIAPGEMRQLVMNLVKNAAESLGDRPGVVTVSTGWLEPDGADLIDTDCREPADSVRQVCLTVSDTGCGIDGPTCARVLDGADLRTPNGHGFGLASVRRIVAFHGARLLFQSRVGTGTTVRVVFDDKLPVIVPTSAGSGSEIPANGVAQIRVLPISRGHQARYAAPHGRETKTSLSLCCADRAAGDISL